MSDGWDDFLNDAAKDDRIGKHRAMVVKSVESVWPAKDGYPEQPYTKVTFALLTANRSEVDMTWSAPPDTPPSKEELATWTKGRKMGVASAVSIRRQLAQFYGKTVEGLREGDIVGLHIGTRKSKKDGNLYPRVNAIIPLDGIAEGTPASDAIPF
jgi:UDP:flavonoid glycosyltransferase YjiC (YdhE family)